MSKNKKKGAESGKYTRLKEVYDKVVVSLNTAGPQNKNAKLPFGNVATVLRLAGIHCSLHDCVIMRKEYPSGEVSLEELIEFDKRYRLTESHLNDCASLPMENIRELFLELSHQSQKSYPVLVLNEQKLVQFASQLEQINSFTRISRKTCRRMLPIKRSQEEMAFIHKCLIDECGARRNPDGAIDFPVFLRILENNLEIC
ncbi:hypothetical protein Ciccas_008573 [Cichlidogyrus casuarinus]|uniref:Uncharacterized protein n=1 Tax=Cichlidogyrus casuarinus TaxID=1844966 RepID=A0ABD2PZH9_9PLAT